MCLALDYFLSNVHPQRMCIQEVTNKPWRFLQISRHPHFSLTNWHQSWWSAKETFNLIISFESRASRVANNVPKGMPCWKYRLRLSCSVQQLKALGEILSPSRLRHSLLLKRAWREKRRMEGKTKWKQYLLKNGVGWARGTLSVQMCGRKDI